MKIAEGAGISALRYNEYDAPHADLREFVDRVERAGELLRIPGVEWNLEMGTLAEAVYQGAKENPPAILFEDVPGYPKPLPVQRLVPAAGDTRAHVHYGVSATLPVAGTSITLSSLYGRWTVQTYLDGQPAPCGPASRFTISE